MRLLFKIVPASLWAEAEASGVFTGSPVDHRDGFIHLSAAHQVRETAARHFAGQDGLLLAAFTEDALEAVAWEPSRGGDLFPHVHGTIPVSAALWVKPLALRDGVHQFPGEAGA